jgi:hypothetical protein
MRGRKVQEGRLCDRFRSRTECQLGTLVWAEQKRGLHNVSGCVCVCEREREREEKERVRGGREGGREGGGREGEREMSRRAPLQGVCVCT